MTAGLSTSLFPTRLLQNMSLFWQFWVRCFVLQHDDTKSLNYSFLLGLKFLFPVMSNLTLNNFQHVVKKKKTHTQKQTTTTKRTSGQTARS